jgi:HlyD family secretion protein
MSGCVTGLLYILVSMVYGYYMAQMRILSPFAIVILLVVVAGSGFFLYPRLMEKQAKAEQPVIVPQAPKGIGALARIEPRSRVLKISHNAGPEGAKISELLVEEGQNVEKGATLAVLADYPRKKAELAQAEANIKALQARYKVEKLNQDYAAKTLERRRKLLKENAISQSDIEKSEQAYRQAQASLVDIAAQIESAKALHSVAAENLDNMVIVAPIDGTILRIMVRSGERIDPNGLLEMADLTQLDVAAEIYERDIAGIKAGQKATITLTNNEKTYQGVVREIGFQVKGNDLNDTDPLADKDNRVVTVRITLDKDAVTALRHQLYRQVQVSIEL